ncbi:hypothetical protein GGS23DRAFT_592312 [Durotheca rogersii]|uniref:uncharacterized protein n=1 Tax=Durotheca rogersii TaxID=419775 RepID=UPI002220DBFF|nr:uncharacterized protein GGS23DRAFT_592312 [Durotheca rogersii]KAI5868542.1 hypothetical protein GGS23DRAFT_592312 [Durotheca rogersii]
MSAETLTHISNPLATTDQLYRRTLGALPEDLRDIIFFATQCLTQSAGILLGLPQSITAQACIVLARYLLSLSCGDVGEGPLAYEFSDLSATVLYLITKPSAHPRPIRDLYNVYAYLLSPGSPFFRETDPSDIARIKEGANEDGSTAGRGDGQEKEGVGEKDNAEDEGGTKNSAGEKMDGHNKGDAGGEADPSTDFLTESEYEAFRNRVFAIEPRVLMALSFDTHAVVPHGLAVTYLQALDFLGEARSAATGRAVAYLNAALLSPQLLYLTHQPAALAVAAIYTAAFEPGARVPTCNWWEAFDVDREELGFLLLALRSLDGWARARRGATPRLWGRGMVTRAMVKAELTDRGLRVVAQGNVLKGDDDADADMVDEETAMMRKMDERAAQLEAC